MASPEFANGNLTWDGSTTFGYDVENRMVGAGGLKNAALRYDPLGRLYEVAGPTATTRFLYDGDALVAEYDQNANLLRRYVHRADLKSDDPIAWYEGSSFSGSSERFMRPDWEGSIGLVTDNAGTTIYAANTYDEYGIPGSANAGRFQYTGQAWIPELGMYYYKARMYSPTLGRFMQTDPIGYKDNVNLYAYVANDPVDKTDYSGNGPIDEEAEEIAEEVVESPVGQAIEAKAEQIGNAIERGLGIEPAPSAKPSGPQPDPLAGAAKGTESPEIGPADLKGKTDGELRNTARDKGFTPDSKNPNKFRDPVSGKERMRIDKGHVDPTTGKPYNNPNAAGDHAHGYGPDGKTPIRDPDTGDKHFPIRPDF